MTSTGRKRIRNGSVSRRVVRGSVTESLSFRPSKGLDRLRGGSDPSASLSSPMGRRWSSMSCGDHLLRDAATHGPTDDGRDLGAGAAPVDRVQDRVEQRRELQRLPVAAADQRWWGPVAGPHHRPEELEVIDARRRVDEGGHCRAGLRDRLGSPPKSPPDTWSAPAVRPSAESSADAVSVSGGSTEAWSMSDICSDVASRGPGDRLVDDGVLLGDRRRLRVVGEDVGRHRGVDRRRHVGVGRDRAVDRSGEVGVEVDVDVDVEQVALQQVAGVEPVDGVGDVVDDVRRRCRRCCLPRRGPVR